MRIERDPAEFMEMRCPGEGQVIMTGVSPVCRLRLKVDSLLPDRIVDQKVMRDMADVYSPEGRSAGSVLESIGSYEVQGAI